ncbi:uncharacterized protein LOC133737652 [Rosa rugosa]|uniref:uncharacterized protein LOC133737652 n=1 Tax=Rosa rugosa TaxID=74645 RepID=UPI002B40615A|nr:uncharacterized protein LOC133737652 [Rosa rugosa]
MFLQTLSNIAELGPSTLVIKTLKPEHKCASLTESHHLTYHRIAKEVQEDLFVDEEWSRNGMHNHIQKKFNVDVSTQKIARGRAKAKRMNDGHYIQQYNMLASYKKELLRSNPGSTVQIKTEMVGEVRRFHRLYICLAACKKGWIEGCRPLIGLDGCHIKGQHPGQLLSVVGVDGNNGMFPIAWAITEVENRDTWRWFLEYLAWDLKMERPSFYTFIIDKQKGLGMAIAELFPGAEHRHCVRHLYNNFKAKHPGEGLKQLVWDAARSSTRVWFNKHMDEMKGLDDVAWTWFQDKSPEQWSRAYFRDDSRCDLLLNNLCESFNAAILPARGKPIITMLEKIRMDMMVRMANRRVAAQRWTDMVGPRIRKILEKVAERSSCYRAYHSGEFEFQITGGGEKGSKHAVDQRLHICTCRRWQISGIPCVHAICAIRSKKADPALFCDDYLMPSTYMESYNPIIHPIAGEDDWDQVDCLIAHLPHIRSKPADQK